PVSIAIEDGSCTREGGFVAARKIVSDSTIVGVHGTTCSISTIPAAEIISEAGMVMISGCSTTPALTGNDGVKGEHWQPGFFRTAPNDRYQAIAAAHFAYNELKHKKAATVSDGDAYTRGLVSSFEKSFMEHGGEIVFSSEVNRGDKNMIPLLQAIAGTYAEILFFPIFPPEGNYLVEHAKTINSLNSLDLMGADGLLNSVFVDSIGHSGKGMYFIGPGLPDGEKYQEFFQDFFNFFEVEPQGTYQAHNYDAAMILLNSIKETSYLLDDGSLIIERQSLRDHMRALKEFSGLTGSLSCGETGDCGVPKYKLFQLDDPDAGYSELQKNVMATFEYDPDKPSN
ncbi:MAG: branched-chain amino acid ABC transporter substrate-binding protein, partial [Desulfonatronovibrio sp.]